MREYPHATMHRLIYTTLLLILSTPSCDRMIKAVKAMKSEKNGSMEEQIKISSPSKPEIVAAFEAISKATREHNRVFLQNHDAAKPANELAYSAGIALLGQSAREHGGLAKKVIDAVASTWVHEKDLFTPFDTIDRQLNAMPTWSRDAAIQLRGYIQIIDQIIITYDGAVSYLERGEAILQRRNFDRYGVPGEVSAEFFRLNQLYGKEVTNAKLSMFREQRSALQCYREALTSIDPATANQHTARAQEHERKAKEFEGRMIAEIRKQQSGGGLL